MRQIRPTIDELKKRYSCALARRNMTERRHAARPSDYKAVKTPDNSEPWLLHPPRSLAECMWISDQVSRREKHFRERLPVCDAAEARGMMERSLNPEVLAFALENPDAEVRAMALAHLREFEAEGDPYSRDILAAWRTKNPTPG